MKSIQAKIVLLGSQGVGKTSLVLNYVTKKHTQEAPSPTIGATFFNCKIQLEDIKVKMQIWDTAGQERFRAMTPMFYRGANAALLVFDLTDYASFDDIMGWVTELQRKVQDSMVLILVGNKCDLSERREVNKDEAIQYAKSIGGYYFETSSVSNHDHYQSIEKVFTQTALGLIRLSESSNTVLRRYDSIDSLPHISLSNNSIMLDSAMATSAITLGGDLLNDDNGLPMETGRVENVAFSHDHIALGNEHRGGCCW